MHCPRSISRRRLWLGSAADLAAVVSDRNEQQTELFRLSDDPAETNDLAAAELGQVVRLQKLFAAQQALDP